MLLISIKYLLGCHVLPSIHPSYSSKLLSGVWLGWFTVARKLVQMRKGGWMTRQPFMCSRTIRNGRASSIRKWWWWPHGYPSAAFETPFTGNQPRHRQRVFITHVQHYKAEIEPELYSLVIDLFSIVWRLENSNESSRNWKCHGRTTRQFSTHCTMPK